jgi:hypothetical protein
VFLSRRKAAVGEFLQFICQFSCRMQYVTVADVDVPAASGIDIPGLSLPIALHFDPIMWHYD